VTQRPQRLRTAAPERSDTSRSALGPPSITVMFNFRLTFSSQIFSSDTARSGTVFKTCLSIVTNSVFKSCASATYSQS